MKGLVRSAVESTNIFLDVPIGCRSDDGGMDHQVLKIPPLRFFLQLTHGRGFHVKDPHAVASPEKVHSGRIVQGIQRRIVDAQSLILTDSRQGVPDDGQGAVAEQVDFDQACLFGLFLFHWMIQAPLALRCTGT